ncbi:hypothetical protein O6P43_027710 [Quillaja saponaria]|uniref:Uncharacterized protein n=1 Tax=Quillaja saponaria TaxID=32244 RepID=A0AAD7PDM1_QUISA|nr:hypothetical protein O6P43_027710 [Quillaja saponaria]
MVDSPPAAPSVEEQHKVITHILFFTFTFCYTVYSYGTQVKPGKSRATCISFSFHEDSIQVYFDFYPFRVFFGNFSWKNFA